jgi:type II secretion system protein I
MNSPGCNRIRTQRRGLTLLEVVTAIAILGGALIAIGNLMYLGSRAAGQSSQYSAAQVLCDAKMAEVCAGVLPLQSTAGMPIDESPGWEYSIDIGQANVNGLLAVTVSVQQSSVTTSTPVVFTLMRWIPDPNYEPPQPVLQ